MGILQLAGRGIRSGWSGKGLSFIKWCLTAIWFARGSTCTQIYSCTSAVSQPRPCVHSLSVAMHRNLYELGFFFTEAELIWITSPLPGAGSIHTHSYPSQPANSSLLKRDNEIWLLMAVFLCIAPTGPKPASTLRFYFWIRPLEREENVWHRSLIRSEW